jgi:hypothetical protein
VASLSTLFLRHKLAFAALSFVVVPLVDAEGGRIGNTADWRRIMLDQAQREASNWVNSGHLNTQAFYKDSLLDRDSATFKFVTQPSVLLETQHRRENTRPVLGPTTLQCQA